VTAAMAGAAIGIKVVTLAMFLYAKAMKIGAAWTAFLQALAGPRGWANVAAAILGAAIAVAGFNAIMGQVPDMSALDAQITKLNAIAEGGAAGAAEIELGGAEVKPQRRFAAAMEFGSQEAWSTIVNAMRDGTKTPLETISKHTKATADVLRSIDRTLRQQQPDVVMDIG